MEEWIISDSIFNHYMDEYIKLIQKDESTPPDILGNEYMVSRGDSDKGENYKTIIYNLFHQGLSEGKKPLNQLVEEALAYKKGKDYNNLVSYYSRDDLKNKLAAPEANTILQNILFSNQKEMAFDQAYGYFAPHHYDYIALLFFLSDIDHYLPLSPENFDLIFESFGIDYKLQTNITWDNYTGYIRIVSELRDRMEKYFGIEKIRLIDAHSILWIIRYAIIKHQPEDITSRIVSEAKDRKVETKSRIGQEIYRDRQCRYWENRCAVTGCSNTDMLIASHAKPWAKCKTHAECLDRYNGFLLTPNLDSAFDQGYISFDDNGHIIISKQLSPDDCKILGINDSMEIRPDKFAGEHIKYLKYHRKYIFKK